MRIGIYAVLFTLLFALLLGFVPNLQALDEGQLTPAQDLVGKPAADGPHLPDDGPAREMVYPEPADIATDSGRSSGLVAPAKVPPLIVGQNGDEMLMIASNQAGEVISVVTFTPGSDDSQPQVTSVFDLGIGFNGQVTWDLSGNSLTFSFLP